MAAVYSVVFFRGAPAAAGLQTLYTVPAGKIAVLRDIDLYGVTAGANDFRFGEGTGSHAFIAGVVTGQFTPYEWRGRQVFNAAETIVIVQSNGTVAVALSGYLLDA